MLTPENPPAFPRAGNVSDIRSDDFDNKPQEGMTLRDYFAAAALTGIITQIKGVDLSAGVVPAAEVSAKVSYKMADAMLAAREEAK
jgi:hypothetical protein